MGMAEGSGGILNHPRPFYILFLVEMWERFGFYGMQALLVLFMVQEFGFSDELADSTFSAFAALVYAFICVGGWLGDKGLGSRRTMFLGALVLAGGYGLLGISSAYLYPALGIIIAGNALFKANPSALVSKLYDKGDFRVDGAFTLYYMAINIGSFLAMSLCPLVAHNFGWEASFRVCFAGMCVAIVNFLIWHRTLGTVGSDPDFRPVEFKWLLLAVGIAGAIATVSAIMLKHIMVAHEILFLALGVVVVLFIREVYRASAEERPNMLVCLVLIVEAVVFFVLYQQMPTSLNLFALRNVDPHVLGIPVEPASFQALNPFWIMIASPVLAWVYAWLGETGHDLSLPTKFALGMLMCSLGFLTVGVAADYFFNSQGVISGNWLIATYGFQSVGELLVSGLGLAMVACLTPERSMGFMMGAWFMSQSVAMILGGKVAALASIPAYDPHAFDAMQSLHVYSALFMKIGLFTLGAATLMFVLVPVLKKHISE